jgi:hypothetical protein
MRGAGILPAFGAEATEILGFSASPNGGRDARPTLVFHFFHTLESGTLACISHTRADVSSAIT